MMRHRYESFGGIIASDDPPFLAFVDRTYLRELGLPDSPLWKADQRIGQLSAPVEVHLACTNRCSMGCRHCYMDSGGPDSGEMNTAQFKQALDALSAMGVFHVALGGGEALERDDLFELADHARRVGLVPNLTTNGRLVDAEIARKLTRFGQVNVSLDGVGAAASTFRQGADFDDADRALGLLIDAGVSTGINCVVGRKNFDHLPDLFDYAADKGFGEIELLRFKPSGRGTELYQQHKTTPRQNRDLYPLLQQCAQRTGVTTKIDCSFVPMLCHHRPPQELLEAFCVCGCEAGNFLIGARSDGRVCGCSFLPPLDLTVDRLADAWAENPHLQRYRHWDHTPQEPCADCEYLRFCKGGCRAVALAVTGTLDAPDPDCPRVEDFHHHRGRQEPRT